jgi:hypothetical protein
MANFSALAAARHALLNRLGWDVEANGLFSAPPIKVIVGEEVHVSVLKALSLLGLGRERVVRIAVDGQGRMRPEAIQALTEPAIICIQAGNVNTGAFDPAREICDIAKTSGSGMHVDGAFGLWAAAGPDRAQSRGNHLASVRLNHGNHHSDYPGASVSGARPFPRIRALSQRGPVVSGLRRRTSRTAREVRSTHGRFASGGRRRGQLRLRRAA